MILDSPGSGLPPLPSTHPAWIMSSPQSQVRQRGAGKKRGTTPTPDARTNGSADTLTKAVDKSKAAVSNQWDYKVALVVVTLLGFATRFWGISYPKEVVFDEVHFGKVRAKTFSSIGFQSLTHNLRLALVGSLNSHLVRFLLPSTHVFLRCSPTIWQTSLRPRRLACWLQWRVPL